MSTPIVFMFSGQGSQYFQMGRELYENNPCFRYWMRRCDRLVEPLIGCSLGDIVYRERASGESFSRVVCTNPALLSVQYGLVQTLQEMTVQPDYLLGYSLGETAAAIVSGALSLEEALEFSVAQARLLEERTAPAGMLAILEKEAIVHELHPLFRRVIVTGRNFDGNFVVTGEEAEIAELERSLESLHVATVRLAVNYGFHTAMIEPIKSEFIRLARTLSYGRVEIPTISAFSGSEVESVSAEYLWDVMRHPVDFHRAVTVMLNRGDYVFLDVGPSGSLATLVKHALPRGSASSAVSAINQYGRNLQTLSKLQTALSGAAMFVA